MANESGGKIFGIAIPISIVAAFVFAVSFFTLYAQTHISEGTACRCTLPIPILIPTLSSIGVMVGSLVFYFMSGRAHEKAREIRVENVSAIKDSAFSMLKMLPSDEKKLLELMAGSGGKILQSRLPNDLGIDKVKSFRLVQRLIIRGILEKNPYGKTNIIMLKENFRKILC